MATNNNGHLLDDAGNVVVDFVWGNFPLQPNDVRPDTATGRLDFALSNHTIAEGGWNGYPLFEPNTDGEFTGSAYAYTPFIVVPNVLGLTTVLALDALKDAGYVVANITQTLGVTNTAKAITAIARTAGNAEVSITATGAVAAYPVGTKITIGASTGIPTELVGDWTVTGNSSTNVVKFTSNATTVLSVASGALTGSASLTGKSLTVKTQTVAANADSIALGTAITTTSWA